MNVRLSRSPLTQVAGRIGRLFLRLPIRGGLTVDCSFERVSADQPEEDAAPAENEEN